MMYNCDLNNDLNKMFSDPLVSNIKRDYPEENQA